MPLWNPKVTLWCFQALFGNFMPYPCLVRACTHLPPMGSYCALWEPKAQTWPVRTLYALYTHFNRHFEISKCHFGIQKWHFDVFKRSWVISCRIRAWLGLVHTFQATNGFLLRTLGTKSTDLACTHFVRTLYALSKALWKAQSGTLGFQSATFKFQCALWGPRKRFYVI